MREMVESTKCVGCLFRAKYLNVPICKRKLGFKEAAREAAKSGACQYHITKKQVAELQDMVDLQALLCEVSRGERGEENG